MNATSFEPADQLAAAMLLQGYAWASDQRDREALVACFTLAGALWISEAGAQPLCAVEGASRIADWVIARHCKEFAAGHVRRHLVSFPVLLPKDDHLLSRAYFTVLLRDEVDLRVGALGWYEDELVNEGASWRIRRRLVHIDAKRGTTVANEENRR